MASVISIDKRSLDQQAAAWIRDAVLSGNLIPGSRVTEAMLAEQIGLSRSTVRTAMQRVASEGLLVQQAYTGWEVAPLSPEDAWELYTLRSELEGLASQLAAERIDDAGRTLLLGALEELSQSVEAKDRRRVATADISLHRLIVGLAKHRRLSMLHSQIIDPIQLYVLSTNRESFDDLISTHTHLVAAILRGDAANARQLACEHVNDSCGQLMDRLRQPAKN